MNTFLLISFIFFLLIFSYRNPAATLILLTLYVYIIELILIKVNITGYRFALKYVCYFLMILGSFRYSSVTFRKILSDKSIQSMLLLTMSMTFYNLFFIAQMHHKQITEFQTSAFLFTFIPFFIIALVFNKKDKLDKFVNYIIIGGLIFYVLLYLNIDFSKLVIGDRTSIYQAAKLDSINLSRIAASILIVSYLKITDWRGSKKWFSIAAIIAATVSLYAILLTAQRGTIIGIAAAVLFLIYKSKAMYKIKLIGTSILIILVFILLVGPVDIDEFGIVKRFTDLEKFKEYNRYDDYFKSFRIFKGNSFLIGTGSLGYFFHTGREYPHNFILECMVEYGILGLIAALMLIINGLISMKKLTKIWHSDVNITAISCLWLMMLISVMVSGNIISNYLFFIYSALLTSSVISQERMGFKAISK